MDSQTPGRSSAGAQGTFRWQDQQFLTPLRPPASAAHGDAQIAGSPEDAAEDAEVVASLEDAETVASLEDAEPAASLEGAAEEDAHRTAGLQQLPTSQPKRSGRKRKAKSSASQGGAKTGRRTLSLERSGADSEDESEIELNEYQEVTMETVQQYGCSGEVCSEG